MADTIGQQSCHDFLNKPVSAPARKSVYVQWVAGYVTAKYESGPHKRGRVTDLESIAMLTTSWCMDHDHQAIRDAARAIVARRIVAPNQSGTGEFK